MDLSNHKLREMESPLGGSFLIGEDEVLELLTHSGRGILQKKKGFRFGVDAVLLSVFAGIREGEKCLDIGTGSGILPLLLSAKSSTASFTGLEIQESYADMAERSVRGNHLEERIRILSGDFRRIRELLPSASFDLVVSNPPYAKADGGILPPEEGRRIARFEVEGTLAELVAASKKALRERGRLALVHRSERLAEVLEAVREAGFGLKRLQFVHETEKHRSKLFLLEAEKAAGDDLKIEEPILLRTEDGSYREEVRLRYGF